MNSRARRIAFFAHDSGESVVIKRATAFQAAGAAVIGFMFHRERSKKHQPPNWQNVTLGVTVDRNYLGRLPKLLSGLWKVLRHRRQLHDCDVIYARNLDMMLLATLAKLLSRSPAKLAYEVLDVQRILLGTGGVSRLFRWCERRVLAACDLLVLSSPSFMTQYFKPYQGYRGPWFLLENKVSASQFRTYSEVGTTEQAPGPPWIIGWFGTLRCARSLDILSRLASLHSDNVSVHIRGLPSQKDIPMEDLLAATSNRANFRYYGPYESPKDLSQIYGQVHFTWAIDFLDAGFNSDWLLPNRLYEGGIFNAISIAREGTATGDMVMREGLGVALREPIDQSLSEWLEGMTLGQYQQLLGSARRAPRSLFIEEGEIAGLLEALAANPQASMHRSR